MWRLRTIDRKTGAVIWEGESRYKTKEQAQRWAKTLQSIWGDNTHLTHEMQVLYNGEVDMKNIHIVKVMKFNDRDYAIIYTAEGVPHMEYRWDKNHENHAINGFTRDHRLMGQTVYNDIEEDRTHVVELLVDGKSVAYQEV